MGEAVFFGVFLLFGSLGLAVMLAVLVVPEWRANRHYLKTSGTVLAKRVAERHEGKSVTYRPEVHVRYQVDGKQYETWTYDAAGIYASRPAAANSILARFEVGGAYPCWYDPMDPEQAVIVRGYSGWYYLLLLVPGSLAAIGVGGLLFALSHWGRSTERRAALAQRAALMNPLREEAGQRRMFPSVPSDADLRNSPGTTLPFRLPIAAESGWTLFGLATACVLWNGVVIVMSIVALRKHLLGNPDWMLALALVPLVLVGLGLVIATARQLMLATGIGTTRLEISRHPLHPGETCEVLLSQAGRLKASALEVLLVCEEQATYRQGTDTRIESRRVWEVRVFRRESFEVEAGMPYEEPFSLLVPASAMHSFVSPHNEIRWKLEVRADVPRWPNFVRSFPVIVSPRHPGEPAR